MKPSKKIVHKTSPTPKITSKSEINQKIAEELPKNCATIVQKISNKGTNELKNLPLGYHRELKWQMAKKKNTFLFQNCAISTFDRVKKWALPVIVLPH
jgi:hypothetical protein